MECDVARTKYYTDICHNGADDLAKDESDMPAVVLFDVLSIRYGHRLQVIVTLVKFLDPSNEVDKQGGGRWGLVVAH